MRLSRTFLLPLALAVSTSGAFAADSDWTNYMAPTNDFDVDMPGAVDAKTTNLKGISVRSYKGSDNVHNYVVTATTVPTDPEAFKGFTEGIQDSVQKNDGKVSSSQNTSGPGWEGVLVDATKPGQQFTYLAVHPTDKIPLGYALMTNAGPDEPGTKKFFSSFKVHVPHVDGDATYGGLVDPQAERAASTPYEQGRQMGLLIGYMLPFIIVIAIAIFVAKRAKKKQQ